MCGGWGALVCVVGVKGLGSGGGGWGSVLKGNVPYMGDVKCR